MEKPQGYIGITGVQNHEQVKALAAFAEECGLELGHPEKRALMVAGLVSKHTLSGGKYSDRALDPANLENLFGPDDGVLRMLHIEQTEAEDDYPEVVQALCEKLLEKNLLDAIQINGTRPAEQIREIAKLLPGLKIVYQLRPELLEQGIRKVLTTINEVRKSIDYVLIDPSCGRGEEFDVNAMSHIYQACEKAFPELRFGVAGGFTPENTEARSAKIAINTRQFNGPTIDIETGVHNRENNTFDLDLSRQYIAAATASFENQ